MNDPKLSTRRQFLRTTSQTGEAFIETATFLMSLKSQQERRLVRWDAAREEIV